MGLHEYKVKAGRNAAVDTTMLLSDEDAAAIGLTKKDRVSNDDQTVEPHNPEFQPRTEADLNPNAAADELARVTVAREQAEAALEAAKAEEAAVIESQEAAAKAQAEADAQAEKDAAAAKNKQAPRAANKSAAQTPNK